MCIINNIRNNKLKNLFYITEWTISKIYGTLYILHNGIILIKIEGYLNYILSFINLHQLASVCFVLFAIYKIDQSERLVMIFTTVKSNLAEWALTLLMSFSPKNNKMKLEVQMRIYSDSNLGSTAHHITAQFSNTECNRQFMLAWLVSDYAECDHSSSVVERCFRLLPSFSCLLVLSA